MKALILRHDADAAIATARVLVDCGYQISCCESHKIADAVVQLDTFDLLVMDEMIDGQLTHTLALSAERQNPDVTTFLMTDRGGAQTDDLFDLIPSLHALLGHAMPATVIGQLALASTHSADTFHVSVVPDVAAQKVPLRPVLPQCDTDEDTTINADIDALAACLPAETPSRPESLIGPQEPRHERRLHHIAHVSIIGEGRPLSAGLQ